MKGMVGLALILLVIGIAYVLVNRPSVQPKNVTGPSTSNQVFGVLGTLGGKLVSALSIGGGGKVAPPSGLSDVGGDAGTYTQGPSHVEDNTLVNDSGQTLTYGTD